MTTKIRRMFPGGNTSEGFYSYFDNILGRDANRLYILKGGPGTGKSTIMRKFAEKAILLYHDESLWKEKQTNGFKTLSERFDKNFFHACLFSRIYELSAHLDKHRHQNFTGQMLQHHTHQSTKYMSKWIEEKNK